MESSVIKSLDKYFKNFKKNIVYYNKDKETHTDKYKYVVGSTPIYSAKKLEYSEIVSRIYDLLVQKERLQLCKRYW